jgi:hypothetical protein
VAQLWLRSNDAEEWTPFRMTARAYDLSVHPPRPLDEEGEPGSSPRVTAGSVAVVGAGDGARSFALVVSANAGARVNGLPLAAGLRALVDRDEIQAPSFGTCYFSTEELAVVEPLPDAAHVPHCPRCRLPVEPESPAVRCPACQLWHHQTSDYPCWTYAATCAVCPQPTRLDGAYQWTPAEVWS